MAGAMARVQSATAGRGGAQCFTEENALEYLIGVRNTLEDEDKYDELENIMKDLHYKRIGPREMIKKAKVLLKGHGGQLLLGFNRWIPERYRSPVPVSKQINAKNQELVERYGRAMGYVQKVRTRFENEYHVYVEFRDIVNIYMRGGLPVQEVHQKVKHLFCQHADLLDDFRYFIRDNGPVSSDKTIRPAAAKLASRSEEKTTTGMRSQQAGERVGAERKRKGKMDDSIHIETGKKAAPDTADDCKDKDLHICQRRLSNSRESARRIDGLIRKQPQARDDGEELQDQSSPRKDDKELSKSSSLPKLSQEQVFFQNVKERLWNFDAYQEFLKCINMFSREVITSSELQRLVFDILGQHSDLMAGLNDFLSSSKTLNCDFSSEQIDLGESAITVKTPIKAQKNKQCEQEPKDCDKEDHIDQDQRKPRKRKRDNLEDVAAQKEVPGPKASSNSSKNKISKKLISHLNVSEWKCCTPSYRLRPKGYPKPLSTHYTEVAHEVSNECCVCVPQLANVDFNSSDVKFSMHTKKNRHQEIIFKCEDDRSDLYLLLESTAATARRVKELVDYIQNPEFKQQMSTFLLNDHLSAINLRCIKHTYGDHGVDVIDKIRKNPTVTLPVVLRRLWQTHHELSQRRIKMDRVWAQLQAKHYAKSLG